MSLFHAILSGLDAIPGLIETSAPTDHDLQLLLAFLRRIERAALEEIAHRSLEGSSRAGADGELDDMLVPLRRAERAALEELAQRGLRRSSRDRDDGAS